MNPTESRIGTLLLETSETTAATSLKPFLSDRIMRKIQSLHLTQESLSQILWLTFRPFILGCVVLTLVLISCNIFLSRNYDVAPTTTELVFGLQPLTLITAYSSDLDVLTP